MKEYAGRPPGFCASARKSLTCSKYPASKAKSHTRLCVTSTKLVIVHPPQYTFQDFLASYSKLKMVGVSLMKRMPSLPPLFTYPEDVPACIKERLHKVWEGMDANQ